MPPRCALRVANEVRAWKEGKCLVFDDTSEHEAWNLSDLEESGWQESGGCLEVQQQHCPRAIAQIPGFMLGGVIKYETFAR